MRNCYLLSGLLLAMNIAATQTVSWEYLAPVPEKLTNQAVATARVGDTTFVYTFTGLDSTLECTGDHLRVYAYNTLTDSWQRLADIVDAEGGKIAAAASTVKNQVYVVGGYHLADADCDEVSSDRIHRFDPLTQAFIADGSPIPVPIDDHVQAVWRDSLLYVVTGWSTNTNVGNVQVYNPTSDEWQQAGQAGTGSNFRVFGGSGVIIGDTIYYAGGARSSFNFPATQHFRKGAINPANPLEITWEGFNETKARGYRMAAGTFQGQAIWLGGSSISYNFDALAYTNNAVVPPLDRILRYDPATGRLDELVGFIPAVMDFRGMAELGDGEYLLVGGMLTDQQVSDRLLKVTISDLTDVAEVPADTEELTILPNPTSDWLEIQWPTEQAKAERWVLHNANGQVVAQGEVNTTTNLRIRLGVYPAGSYYLQLLFADGSGVSTKVLRH